MRKSDAKLFGDTCALRRNKVGSVLYNLYHNYPLKEFNIIMCRYFLTYVPTVYKNYYYVQFVIYLTS